MEFSLSIFDGIGFVSSSSSSSSSSSGSSGRAGLPVPAEEEPQP